MIDICGTHINVRDLIEQFRQTAENELEERPRKAAINRGILQLRRYFMLIAFQRYPNAFNSLVICFLCDVFLYSI